MKGHFKRIVEGFKRSKIQRVPKYKRMERNKSQMLKIWLHMPSRRVMHCGVKWRSWMDNRYCLFLPCHS